jgi:cystathionine beta-lyase/cystathionine gamma-synthase
MDSTRLRKLVGSSEVRYLRLHIGLEDPDDLMADLENGFAQMHAATAGAR